MPSPLCAGWTGKLLSWASAGPVGLMWIVSSKERTRNLVTLIREARTSKATKTDVPSGPEGQEAQPQ